MSIYSDFHDLRARLYQQLARHELSDDQARALAGDMRQAIGRLEQYHQHDDDRETEEAIA